MRSERNRKPVDRLDPSPSLTQVGKSRKCNEKLRRSNSPGKKTPMQRPPASNFIRVHDRNILDEYQLVQFICTTSKAEGEGDPVDMHKLLGPVLRLLLNLRNTH